MAQLQNLLQVPIYDLNFPISNIISDSRGRSISPFLPPTYFSNVFYYPGSNLSNLRQRLSSPNVGQAVSSGSHLYIMGGINDLTRLVFTGGVRYCILPDWMTSGHIITQVNSIRDECLIVGIVHNTTNQFQCV